MNFKKSFKYIVLVVGVLCLFSGQSHAQIQPGKLKKEILESRDGGKKPAKDKNDKKNSRDRKRPRPKPLKEFTPLADIKTPYDDPKAKLIYVEKARLYQGRKSLGPRVQVLKGEVCFRQDETYLYCDSAYFNSSENSFDAYSNVSIVQGDTLFIYGDVLFYNGNTKLARIRKNVKMVDRKMVLTTDSLNYDRGVGLAYYFNGGKIDDRENVLTSERGDYYTKTGQAIFSDSVLMTNKEFNMKSARLNYNTKTHLADIVDSTDILYKDETQIYTHKGWHNTENKQSMLLDRSVIIHKDKKSIVGDTIYYDKTQKYGEAFGDVILMDSAEMKTLTGNYLYYNEENSRGLAADSALMTDWSGKDTMYVHADTLLTYKEDSINYARAWRGVRIFRNDIQAVCDSMYYNGKDSVLNFYTNPVLWHESNQMSGSSIQAFIRNKEVYKMHLQVDAMTSEQVDSIHFNQISGKDIVAYIDSGALRKVEVDGNAQTLYLPIDEADNSRIGINKTESSHVNMYFKDRKIDRIVLTAASNGVVYPLDELKGDELYYTNFFWLSNQRPTGLNDLFLQFQKGPRSRFPEGFNKPVLPATEIPVELPDGATNETPELRKASPNATDANAGGNTQNFPEMQPAGDESLPGAREGTEIVPSK